MKRSLLVAALSTVAAGSALAQSSVTVYGRLNESVERQTVAGSSKYVLQNNGSRLGFRGLEDIGGGLKAAFTLEHRLNADDGTLTNKPNAFWGGAGESSVALAGGFGQVKLGHYTSEAYFATSDVTDLLNHGTGTSSDALYKYLNNDSNKVSYRTPNIAGLTAEFAVLLGEGAPATPKRGIDFAANYNVGNLGLGLGYERDPFDNAQIAARASYSASPFTVTGYVQRYYSNGADAFKTIVRVSGQYDIGAIELHLAGGVAGELDGAGVLYDEAKTRQYTAGANYNLSKRTKVFAFYNRVKVDNVEATSQVAAGIRHNF